MEGNITEIGVGMTPLITQCVILTVSMAVEVRDCKKIQLAVSTHCFESMILISISLVPSRHFTCEGLMIDLYFAANDNDELFTTGA